MIRFASLAIGLTLLTATPSFARLNVISGDIMKGSEAIARSAVRVRMKTDAFHTCSGSLISENLVLTAAHCLVKDPSKVIVDFYSSPGKFVSVPVRRYLTHEDFENPASQHSPQRSPQRSNDLALLYFEKRVPRGHLPVMLSGPEEIPELNAKIRISGFGMSNITPETFQESDGETDTLRTATLTLAGQEGDSLEFKDPERKASACFGDSGGPAWVEKGGEILLIGVSSHLTPPICKNSSIYVSVSWHAKWLQTSTQKLTELPPFIRGSFKHLVSSRSIGTLIRQLKSAEFDSDRLSLLENFLQSIPADTGVSAQDGAHLLPSFSLDEHRLSAFELLLPLLSIQNRTEARSIALSFKYDRSQMNVLATLDWDGIIELLP